MILEKSVDESIENFLFFSSPFSLIAFGSAGTENSFLTHSETPRILIKLRTVTTTGEPSITFHIDEVRAAPCECPAIVKSPFYLHLRS